MRNKGMITVYDKTLSSPVLGVAPAVLYRTADSLVTTGQSAAADSLFSILANSYPFLPQGTAAMAEHGRFLTDSGRYMDAIKAYRRYLLSDKKQEKRCNTMFMIGFNYGEYLRLPILAEKNYKWILKYIPNCELADDAEFMTLHLDEPMITVEEIREEASRQGKKQSGTTAQ